MSIVSATSFQTLDVGNDYLEYLFLRLKGAGGLVMTVDSGSDTFAVASPMLASARGPQLFKFLAVPNDPNHVQVINQGNQLAMSINYNGIICFVPPDPTALAQLWSVDANNQLIANNTGVPIGLAGSTFTMATQPNPAAVAQCFEMLYPSDFTFIRNCWTGRFLTADSSGNVSWQLYAPTTGQEWGITSDGFLVNRATAQVLQLNGPAPNEQMPLTTGTQVALGAGDAFQRFNVNSADGAFHCVAGNGFVITTGAAGQAVVTAYSATDYKQLIEFISIFQFFSLECGCVMNGSQPWLARSGNTAIIAPGPTGTAEQMFTVSRYGELISGMDGFVMQSQGNGAVPSFVDPAPDPIGFDSTTFVYNQLPARQANYGSITLRSDPTLGLISYGGRPSVPWMYSPISQPVSGNQSWQLVGAQQSLFAAYQQLAVSFFSNPAPLPGQLPPPDADPELDRLVADLDKAPQVIIALAAGLLDIVAGISVGTVGDKVVTSVAKIVLGSSEVAAKVAVIMQGTVTAASIIAVADGITRAGLWWKILSLLLPNSFWGWALTVAKLSLTIASWAVGAGPAVTGAKIALLVADIIRILASAEAVRDAALIGDHVVRRLAAPVAIKSMVA